MRPSSILSSRPQVAPGEDGQPRGTSLAGFLSTVLLGAILVTGPSVLGAVRPWIDLPILGGVALLLLIQALRLTAPTAIGSMRQIDAIDFGVLLFVGYAVIRWLTSPVEFLSRFEILNVVGYAIVFFFARYGIGRRMHCVWLLILLVALGVGETGFGYFLSLHSNVHDPASLWFPFGSTEQLQLYWAPRWLGTYGCPNHYVSLLVMAMGASLALGCFSRFSWPLRIVFFYLAAVVLVGILYSESRGGWISLVGALGALIVFAMRYGALRWWIPLAGAVLLAVLLAGIFVASPIVRVRVADVRNIVDSGSLDKYLRIQLTEDALRIARDHPVFGTGPATYNFLDPRYQPSTLAVRAVYTHDDYLNCLDDYGLVGFALAMFFVFAVTLALFSRIHDDSPWPDRVLVATGLAAWCALLLHSFLDFNLHIPANAMMLFALVGVALRRGPREDAPHHWSTVSLARFGPWIGVALGLVALLYGAEIVRTALTDYPYESTAARFEFVPTSRSIDGLHQSLAFDSGNVQSLVLLGDLHRVRAMRADDPTEKATEAQKALNAYQKALRANPLDDTILARMGLTYDLMQRYSEAYLCYHAAVEAQPYNGEFWKVLGDHFVTCGLLDKAEQAYSTAAACPHGNEGAAELVQKVRQLLQPPSQTSPEPPPATPETPTQP